MQIAQPSDEELASARGRISERFGTAAAPEILLKLPREVVRDTTLNLARALDGETAVLPRGERLLVGLAVATALGGRGLGAWLDEAAQVAGVSEEYRAAARAVGLTCSTYNGYYKFRALVGTTEYDSFQPALRATPFVKSALDKRLVELICVAVSVQNSCSHCVTGHVQSAKEHGASPAALDETVRVGAVVGALAKWESAG